MRSPHILLIGMLLLTGCATGPSSPAGCPELKHYTRAELDQSSKELKALPKESMVVGMVEDYQAMRDETRVCRGLRAPGRLE